MNQALIRTPVQTGSDTRAPADPSAATEPSGISLQVVGTPGPSAVAVREPGPRTDDEALASRRPLSGTETATLPGSLWQLQQITATMTVRHLFATGQRDWQALVSDDALHVAGRFHPDDPSASAFVLAIDTRKLSLGPDTPAPPTRPTDRGRREPLSFTAHQISVRHTGELLLTGHATWAGNRTLTHFTGRIHHDCDPWMLELHSHLDLQSLLPSDTYDPSATIMDLALVGTITSADSYPTVAAQSRTRHAETRPQSSTCGTQG
ncbi:hypothetical protein ACWKSP_33665 [Micromonosporaceae bacterium Da 78-11]